MSFHVTSWVLKHSEAKLGARLVLIALSEFAHDDGTKAFPSIETLQERTRLSRTGVKEALKRLLETAAIAETGSTRTGTKVYAILMGGSDSGAGGSPAGAGGSDSVARGSDSDPDHVKNRSGNESGKKILSLEEEGAEFLAWLGFHVTTANRLNVSLSVPRHGTSYRSVLARTYLALRGEGYTVEELELASEGVLSDDYMRVNGHTKFDNVLRKEKIGRRVEDGRAYRARRDAGTDPGDKYGQFDD